MGPRERILEAVEPNAQVLIDLIPDLRLLLGDQPAVAELPPDAVASSGDDPDAAAVPQKFKNPGEAIVAYNECYSGCFGAKTSATNKETCKLDCDSLAETGMDTLTDDASKATYKQTWQTLRGCVTQCFEDKKLSATNRQTCLLTCSDEAEVDAEGDLDEVHDEEKPGHRADEFVFGRAAGEEVERHHGDHEGVAEEAQRRENEESQQRAAETARQRRVAEEAEARRQASARDALVADLTAPPLRGATRARLAATIRRRRR